MSFLLGLAALVVLLWAVGRFVLRGPDHSQYDHPPFTPIGERTEPSPEHQRVVAMLQAGAGNLAKVERRERLAAIRVGMDSAGAALPVDGTVTPADAAGVPAEWVVAPEADPRRRLLYIHGGAYMVGSPRSHRAITAELSKRARAAVLAIDYRLMPEHPRRAGIEDCQAAYRWILENGPDGRTGLDALMVAGDSAGGNLTLMSIAWARDAGLRPADAVVALSPATDATWGSPSVRANQHTDAMLGSTFAQLAMVPRAVMVWFTLFSYRINPSNPIVSPLLGDLSGLPPTLVHASAEEMVLDDAVRYVNKANASGSHAVLGVWRHVLHVWHVFVRDVPEAREAFDHIEAFLDAHTYVRPAGYSAGALGSGAP